jgi:cob(I)alamin adenosyltransferase
MKIYTKSGDGGQTGLFGGPRVWKDDPRIDAYGTVDELNAALGLVRCESLADEVETLLREIQSDLFDIGAELATPDPGVKGVAFERPDRVESLELAIDRYDDLMPPLQNFILPAGTRAASTLHMARTICRRAERRLVSLIRNAENQKTSQIALEYLNRLGDLLFVLARHNNQTAGLPELAWRGRAVQDGDAPP